RPTTKWKGPAGGPQPVFAETAQRRLVVVAVMIVVVVVSIIAIVVMSIPIMLIARPFARLVQLDVAALQRARDAVAIRESKREGVVSAGLAVVAHVDPVRESGAAVHFRGPLDAPGIFAEHDVSGDVRPLHLRAVAGMVLIGEVAPELPVLDPAGNVESVFRRCPLRAAPVDPSPASHEIRRFAGRTTPGEDARGRGGACDR